LFCQSQNNIISTTNFPSTTTQPYNSDDMVLFKSFPPLTLHVKRLAYWARWKDQGFGNQKGKAFLRLNRQGVMLATDDLSVGQFAPHTEQILQGIIDLSCGPVCPYYDRERGTTVSLGTILQNATLGDRFELWVIVGGGTGHKLTIKNFRITLNDVSTNVLL
jgi:hypothetical protein